MRRSVRITNHSGTETEEFTGQAAPTLYVGGALSKEWKQDGRLYKYGDISVELQCIKLCRECGISVERADETDGGITISNITSPKVMLEQADQSGRIDPDDFDEQTIIDLFGKAGAQMLIIDAIIGNGDRHAGNFGWIRNTDTGEYVCMAPLYDFDHALDSTLESDRLLTDAVKFCMPYEDEIVRIASIAQGSENEVFKKRAQSIMKLLHAENISEFKTSLPHFPASSNFIMLCARFLNTSFSDPWAILAMRTISSSYGIQNLTASVKSRSDSNVLSNA